MVCRLVETVQQDPVYRMKWNLKMSQLFTEHFLMYCLRKAAVYHDWRTQNFQQKFTSCVGCLNCVHTYCFIFVGFSVLLFTCSGRFHYIECPSEATYVKLSTLPGLFIDMNCTYFDSMITFYKGPQLSKQVANV